MIEHEPLGVELLVTADQRRLDPPQQQIPSKKDLLGLLVAPFYLLWLVACLIWTFLDLMFRVISRAGSGQRLWNSWKQFSKALQRRKLIDGGPINLRKWWKRRGL